MVVLMYIGMSPHQKAMDEEATDEEATDEDCKWMVGRSERNLRETIF